MIEVDREGYLFHLTFVSSKTVLRFSIHKVSTGPSSTTHCHSEGVNDLFPALGSTNGIKIHISKH